MYIRERKTSGYINATSTRDCGLRAGFAAESWRLRLHVG
jgi:hypothetical protein